MSSSGIVFRWKSCRYRQHYVQ